jgi:hypothetical protein
MPVEPFLTQNPLRFRGISDSLSTSHLEGSECCLIHADNPLSATHGIFLNPLVKVGYNGMAYDVANSRSAELSLFGVYMGIWRNRVWRFTTTPMFKEWVVTDRISMWKKKNPGVDEPAWYCLINEMQVLFEKGWRHV